VQVLADWELEAQACVGLVWLLYPPNRFLPTKVRVLIDYLIEHLNVADATSTNVPPA
jgi:DNA-binding transcriptional LysR family regulator